MKRSIRSLTIAVILLAVVAIPTAGCYGEFHDAAGNPTEGHTPSKTEGALLEGYEGHSPGGTATPEPGDGSTKPPPTEVIAENPEGSWSYRGVHLVYDAGKPTAWTQDETSVKFEISKQGELYSAKIDGTPAKVTFDGKRITMSASAQGMTVRYEGTITGDSIVGTFQISGLPIAYDGPWAATRVK